MSLDFLNYSVNSDFLNFSGKDSPHHRSIYPAAVFKMQLDENKDRYMEVAKESELLEKQNAINWLRNTSNTLYDGTLNLKNSAPYETEKTACLAVLKSIKFCSFEYLLDNVKNANDGDQLKDALEHMNEFIHSLALLIHLHEE